MVTQGVAWVYRQYSHDARLLAAEAEAQAKKRGLWALPTDQRVPPWEFRHPKAKTPISLPADAPTPNGHLVCGEKRTCRQMKSCEEARFYLTQCGVSSLDGNQDGIPCNNLCR